MHAARTLGTRGNKDFEEAKKTVSSLLSTPETELEGSVRLAELGLLFGDKNVEELLDKSVRYRETLGEIFFANNNYIVASQSEGFSAFSPVFAILTDHFADG